MEGIHIVHYCHPGCAPLRSITRLPKEEAFRQARALGERAGTAFGRFADFERYYPLRIRAEKWLHESFVALGGRPETEHPLYFVLRGSAYLADWFESGGQAVTLPLADIAPEHVSFTFGDSMSKLDKPERRAPFGVDALQGYLAEHGGVEEFLRSIEKSYTYIEVQLWSDRYVSSAVAEKRDS